MADGILMLWTSVMVFTAQFLAAIIFGAVIPLFIAFQWWRKTYLAKIPFTQNIFLGALSLFLMFVFPLPVIGLGVAYLGENHNASIGITVGWAIVAIVYWPAMKFLFDYLKKKRKR